MKMNVNIGGIMNHYFDIHPPAPKPPKSKKPQPIKSKKKTSVAFFFVIIVLIVVLYISLYGNDNNKQKGDDSTAQTQEKINTLGDVTTKTPGESTPTNQPSFVPSSSNAPEDSQTQNSNNSNEQNTDVKITVLNGGAGTGVANKVKTKLEENGVAVYKTGNAKSTYSRTVIYYTNVNLSFAQKIQETLADYNPKLEEDNSIVDNENIIVVIGQN